MPYGSLNTSDARRIVDYATAVAHEAGVVPIRGYTLKPYGKRTRKTLTIHREGEDVVVKLYTTKIIRYKPDDTIIVDFGGWDSQTTVRFVEAILALSISRRSGGLWLFQDGVYHKLNACNPMVFKGGKSRYSPQYIPEEPVMRYELDRKAFNKVKKDHYGNFIDYLIGVWKIRNEIAFTKEEAREVFTTEYYEVVSTEELGEWMRNEELWYKAVVVILRRCARVKAWRWDDAPVSVKKSRIDDEIKHTLLTLHAQEASMLTQVEYTGGKVFRDVYAKYAR